LSASTTSAVLADGESSVLPPPEATSIWSSRRCRRVGVARQRRLEQRLPALAEPAHERERDPAQLGILRGQRRRERLGIDVAAPASGRTGDRDRRAPHGGRRLRRQRALDQRDLAGPAARDRLQRAEQLREVIRILRRLAQRFEHRFVAGRRVVDEPSELRRHDLAQQLVPAAARRAEILVVDLLPRVGCDHRARQAGVGDLAAVAARQPEEAR
jgi:hypothetical protein